jgi:hypothetical protein
MARQDALTKPDFTFDPARATPIGGRLRAVVGLSLLVSQHALFPASTRNFRMISISRQTDDFFSLPDHQKHQLARILTYLSKYNSLTLTKIANDSWHHPALSMPAA